MRIRPREESAASTWRIPCKSSSCRFSCRSSRAANGKSITGTARELWCGYMPIRQPEGVFTTVYRTRERHDRSPSVRSLVGIGSTVRLVIRGESGDMPPRRISWVRSVSVLYARCVAGSIWPYSMPPSSSFTPVAAARSSSVSRELPCTQGCSRRAGDGVSIATASAK